MTCQCDAPGKCPIYDKVMGQRHWQICQGEILTAAEQEHYRKTWLALKGQLDPSLGDKVLNFARDAAVHAADAGRQVDDYTREWRRSQCLSCPLFDHENETCTHKQCGCGMGVKRGIIDALGWASKQCPIGRWKNPPPPEVLTVYKKTGSSVSIGLGVNAQITADALTGAGVGAQSIDVSGVDDLAAVLSTEEPPKFVILEGVSWLNVADLKAIAAENYRTTFIVRCHSQIAFLQIEPDGIAKMREIAASGHENLKLAGNSRRFTDWASAAWGACLYLPNLYSLPPAPERDSRDGVLRLASFGAMRVQKHHTVAAAAAVLLAKRLNRPVEFYVNEDKHTPGAANILKAVQHVVAGQELVTLKLTPWQAAASFRKLIANLDLCFQLSATETFNLVTADAAAGSVPTVCGEAIDWVPPDWHAPVDDPGVACDVAQRLLNDNTAGNRGRLALDAYCADAIGVWRAAIERPGIYPASFGAETSVEASATATGRV